MTRLGISLGWSSREDVDRITALVRRAESEGVDACWVIDSQLAMRDAFALLTILARETDDIHIGPGVTNLVTRHETVLASTLATLGSLAPGRVLAGIGAGDSAVFPIGLQPQKLSELRSGVERLKGLLGGESVAIEGTDVKIASASTPRPPLFLAASQPKMLQLAGAIADGVIVMGPSRPDIFRTQRNLVRGAAEAAGRDPDGIFIDLWVTMAVGDEALDAVRSWASAQARWLDRWKSLPQALEPFRDEIRLSAEAYDFASHLSISAPHATTVSDELAAELAIVGSVDECQRQLEEISKVGADRVTASLLTGGREKRLDEILSVWDGLGS